MRASESYERKVKMKIRKIVNLAYDNTPVKLILKTPYKLKGEFDDYTKKIRDFDGAGEVELYSGAIGDIPCKYADVDIYSIGVYEGSIEITIYHDSI